ncbi:formate/nitrite transporter family protein [Arcanobacterium haemolyticum]|nr:formate/nitrite transporter family protein [Arcanobacterium haemolyticum]
MLTIPQTLDLQLSVADHKVAASTLPLRYTVQSMLAGAYIGIAVVVMLAAAGPFALAGSPATKLVAGAVFAIGLILVVFAGAELATSAMMILTQGAIAKRFSWLIAGRTLLFCFIGNLLGAMLFAAIVVHAGLAEAGTPIGDYLAQFLETKSHESVVQLFMRGVLCNILVCLSIWMSNRAETEIGKATVIFWCLLTFITSGYEHVVANMTTFSLGLFQADSLTQWSEFGRNMAAVGLGNLVGGAVFVGCAYYLVAGGEKKLESLHN